MSTIATILYTILVVWAFMTRRFWIIFLLIASVTPGAILLAITMSGTVWKNEEALGGLFLAGYAFMVGQALFWASLLGWGLYSVHRLTNELESLKQQKATDSKNDA